MSAPHYDFSSARILVRVEILTSGYNMRSEPSVDDVYLGPKLPPDIRGSIFNLRRKEVQVHTRDGRGNVSGAGDANALRTRYKVRTAMIKDEVYLFVQLDVAECLLSRYTI